MEKIDAASRDVESELLVAATYATEEGQLSQDTPSRNAPIQAAWKSQDVARASSVVSLMTEEDERWQSGLSAGK